jgi:hypothetical protein
MRPPSSGSLIAGAGVAAVVLGLAVIDDRVRDQLAMLMSGRGPTAEMIGAGTWLEDLVALVVQAVRDQSMAHAPLVIFALAALVLVLLMLRT